MFTLGAFAVIFDDNGRVLLSHRRDYDLWNLPGGRVEIGELPTESVIRETKEETGLDVAIEKLIGVYGKVNSNDVSNSRKKRGKEVDGRFREDYDVGETTGKQNTGQTG